MSENLALTIGRAEVDGSKITETETELIIPAILAREGVLKYSNGIAYRPKEELEQAVKNSFNNAPVVIRKHPAQLVLTDPDEIKGHVTDVTLDANDVDPTTGKPSASVKGLVHLEKAKVDAAFLDDVKSGKLRDVSPGFLTKEDHRPGRFNDQPFDYTQRKMLINHVCVGVQPFGRMRFPQIGLIVDSGLGDVDPGNDPHAPAPPGIGPEPSSFFSVQSQASGLPVIIEISRPAESAETIFDRATRNRLLF